jgi:hypothetical protein
VVDGQPLRPAPVPGDVAGTHDPVTDVESGARRPGFDDDACELPAQDDPPARLGTAHRPDERLSGVHADRADLDQQIAVTEPWLVHLDQFHRESVERVRPLVCQCLHGSVLPKCMEG